MPRRTPLYAAHQRLQARWVEFGGWEMPLHYAGIVAEHQAVRSAAGLFDISHMGQFLVTGPGALDFLNHALTNDLRRLQVGQGHYSLLCQPDGGVLDDLYVFRRKTDELLLVVNAARTASDWDWLQTQVDQTPTPNGFHLRQLAGQCGALALQGPRAVPCLERVIPGGSISGALAPRVEGLARNQIAAFVFRGSSLWIARTGYTGEDGFEIFSMAGQLPELWEALLEAGADLGLQPAGLGARDTLRTEMGYPLYGHELSEQHTPLEAGLAAFVAFDKGDFLGRAALLEQRARGPQRQCVAFRLTARSAPPRPGYPIRLPGPAGASVGNVASGTQSPSLGVGIGLGYVPSALAQPGQALAIEIRGQPVPAEVVRKPLYRPAPRPLASPKPG